MDLKSTIRAYVAGEVTVDAVLGHREWNAIARTVRTRFATTDAVGAEDFAQELRLHAWDALKKVDAKRGDPGAFVTYHAFARARRWYERQQGKTVTFPEAKYFPSVAAVTTDETPVGAFDGVSALRADAFTQAREQREERRAKVRRVLSQIDCEIARACVTSFVAADGDLDEAAALIAVTGIPAGRTRSEIRKRITLEVRAAAEL